MSLFGFSLAYRSLSALFVCLFNWVANELIKALNTVGGELCLTQSPTTQLEGLPKTVRN